MADNDMRDQIAKMEDLDPAARQRVSDALRNALEREATGPAEPTNLMFSRGVFFSRSSVAEPEMIGQLSAMSEDDFAKFSSRLSELKRQNRPT